MKVKYLVLAITLFLFGENFAQQTRSYRDIEYKFNTAKDLYSKNLFGSAQKLFGEILFENAQPEKEYYQDEAAYYYAICALELFHGDAVFQTQNYIETHPESYYANESTFKLANFHFRNKKFKEAIEWYEKTEINKLSGEEISEYYFKIGFCNYARKDFDLATKNFYEVKDRSDNFGILSLYFYSHLKYTNAQYQTALNGFLELEKNEQFKNIAPYYIIQIHYLQRNYEKVIDYSSKIIDTTKNDQQNISKLIGESYYKTSRYEEAIPFLKKYENSTDKLTDADNYELGFSYYKVRDCDNSIKYLNKIKSKDTISQYVAYTMGACYLEQNKKIDARRCFETASKYKYIDEIREDALYNFAQLSYELSMSPFNEAVVAFTDYIENYPNTPRTDKAYDFMINAFLTTKNYQQAIKTIEKMPATTRNSKVDEAYQRLTYFRGIELFTEQKYSQAITMFDNSLKFKIYDKKITALSYYWKAEANYRINNINDAIDQFKQFVNSTGSVSLEEYGRAHYNLGYAYFNKKDYTSANSWFKKYENIERNNQSTTLNDALNRIGDCYYITKDFKSASESYQKAVKIGIIAKDYSLYQLALSYGGLKQYDKKVASLKKLIYDDTDSEYSGNSMFEVGRTYQTFLSNNDSAKYYYNSLIINYPNSKMKKAALSSIASIYFNEKDYSKSLELYKQVMAQYPNSEEAKNANEMIRNIYIEQNNASEYIEYARSEGNTVTQSEEEELLWITAKKVYIEQKYNEALTALTTYLTKIPDGIHKIEANYYKAELHFYFKNYDDALKNYQVVADAQMGAYTEESILKASSILFDKQDWNSAFNYYNKLYSIAESKSTKLIAALGKLRCSYNSEDYNNVITSANNVLEHENTNSEQIREANYKLAKAYLAQNDKNNALRFFEKLASEIVSFEGAESKYRVSEINFFNKKDSIAEENCYDFVQSNSPHSYWVAKTFILLARIYYKQNDVFSATHTLQTVLDSYNNETDGIKKETTDLLQAMNNNTPSGEIENNYQKSKTKSINNDSEMNQNPNNSDNNPAIFNE